MAALALESQGSVKDGALGREAAGEKGGIFEPSFESLTVAEKIRGRVLDRGKALLLRGFKRE